MPPTLIGQFGSKLSRYFLSFCLASPSLPRYTRAKHAKILCYIFQAQITEFASYKIILPMTLPIDKLKSMYLFHYSSQLFFHVQTASESSDQFYVPTRALFIDRDSRTTTSTSTLDGDVNFRGWKGRLYWAFTRSFSARSSLGSVQLEAAN